MAQSNEEVQTELQLRKAAAVDVSGAFNNCLFHSIALYFIANNIPLPDNLFAPNSLDTPLIKQLKTVFKSPEDLKLFATYQQMNPSEKMPSNHYFEQTMVLGVLFRSWFTHQLIHDKATCKKLFAEDDRLNFASLFNEILAIHQSKPTLEELVWRIEQTWQISPSEGSLEDRLQVLETIMDLPADPLGLNERIIRVCGNDYNQLVAQINTQKITERYGDEVLYLANKGFFDRLKSTYNAENLRQYWLERGYSNYCRYLATSGIQISVYDVLPVLNRLGIPYSIHDKNTDNIYLEHSPDSLDPRLEIALNALDGHYFLLRSEQTEEALQAYKHENEQYLYERSIVLDFHENNKVEQCEHSQFSLLLAATLPHAYQPFKALVSRVTGLAAQLPKPAPVISEEPKILEVVEDSSTSIPQVQENKAAVPEDKHPTEEFLPEPTAREAVFINRLGQLRAKHEDLIKRRQQLGDKFDEAAKEAEFLRMILFDIYVVYQKTAKTRSDYRTFRENCLGAIAASERRNILQSHRGCKEILGNICLAIVGIGVIYLLAGTINYLLNDHFLFFDKTDSVEKIDRIKDSIDDLSMEVRITA